MPLRAHDIGPELYETACFIFGLKIEVRELEEVPAEHDAVGVASAGEVTGDHCLRTFTLPWMTPPRKQGTLSMSNHKFAAEAVAISIGEQRYGAGDPLVVVDGAGVLGTLAGLKGLIERFEAQDQTAGQSSREAVEGFDNNRSCA